MHILAAAALITALFGGPTSSPIIAPIDQSADTIVVGGVHAGARIDVYANAVWIGATIAPGPVARVMPVRDLVPGDELIAVEREGAFSSYGVRPTIVAHDYATYHYDHLRTGWNTSEKTLTQATVGSSRFGQVFSTQVDGNVEAQPLFMSGVAIPGLGTHDVVYAATANDSMYALDAATGAVLWQQNYAPAAQGYAPFGQPDIECKFIAPVIGITGTPVIDRSSATMYFVTLVKQTQGMTVTFHHFLHAVDITTGLDRAGSPVEIQATQNVPGGGTDTFDPKWQLQRPGLLLQNGVVYIGFGSFCDLMQSLTHGWILAYSATTLKQVAVFDASLSIKRGLSSFWGGGFGLASDRLGALYVATGNGNFDGNIGGSQWGDTILKLSPSLSVVDYFTPFNQMQLNSTDMDLGGGGTMLLPTQAGSVPHLLVEEGKAPTLFLVNRDHLGRYTPGGPDQIVQELQNVIGPNHGLKGGPGYYVSPTGTPVVLYCGGDDALKALALMTSPSTGLVLIDQTKFTFHGEGGAIPGVTSNGRTAGSPVVWAVERPRATDESVRLEAFDADDLTKHLVDLPAGPWFNPNGGFFVAPTVIAGRAYVGSGNAVTAFGLR